MTEYYKEKKVKTCLNCVKFKTPVCYYNTLRKISDLGYTELYFSNKICVEHDDGTVIIDMSTEVKK